MAHTETGTRDVTYNLVSILYHALQGAENYGIYANDAKTRGEAEYMEFFKEMQQQEIQRADRAKRLLKKALEDLE